MKLKKGDTFSLLIAVEKVVRIDGVDEPAEAMDLTGYTATLAIRDDIDSAEPVEYDCEIINPATDGKINMLLTSTETSELLVGDYYYELIIIKNVEGEAALVKTILEGRLEVRN